MSGSPTQPSRAAVAAVALALAVATAAFQVAVSRGCFLYGDDILMHQVALSLADHGGLEVSSPSRRGTIARSVPGRDGRRYAKYGPGLSLVAVPFVALGDSAVLAALELPETSDAQGNPRAGPRVFAAGLANAAIAGALAAALFLLALEVGYGPGAALAVTLLAAFASPLPHCAAGFLSEPLSALCLTLGVLGLAKIEKDERRGVWGTRSAALVGGAAAGFALLTRPFHLLFLVPLAGGLWLATRAPGSPRRRASLLLLWSLPLVVAAGAFALANHVRFGSVLETGYRGEATRFGGSLLDGLAGQLVSPGKGILWFCPAILLGLLGFAGFRRRAPLVAGTILAGAIVVLVASSKYYQWHGGGCWGPRFLIPLVPLLLSPAAELFARWRTLGRFRRAAIATLVAVSLAAAAVPVLVPFDRHVVDPNLEPERFRDSVWTLRGSPLLRAGAEAPAALAQTIRKLAGAEPLVATHLEPSRLQAPDVAFVRYGSHALLQWTRAGLALAALGLSAALLAARRAA